MSRATARFAGTLVLLLAAAAPLACRSDADKAAAHLARAESYQAEGKQKEALIELRNALQLDPKSADTNFRIASVLEGQQQMGDAAFYYGEAYRLDPDRTDAAIAQGRLLSFAETDRASAIAEEVVEREPQNAGAHALRAQIFLVRGNTEAALGSALTATELAPKDAAAAHQLGIVHEARIKEARETQQKEPDDALFAAAVAAFETAAQYGTPYQVAAALNERAKVFATWPGHKDEAEAAYRELVQRTAASGDATLRRDGAMAARVYARRVRNAPLLRWTLEQVIEGDPDDIAAWSELANFTAFEQGPEAGEAVLRRLIEARPRDAQAQIAYAKLLVRLRSEQDGIEHANSVLGSVDEPVDILGFLVDLHFVMGQNDKAGELVDRMEAQYPGSPRTDLARAQRMLAENRFDEGAELLRDLTGRSESVDAFYLLGIAEAQRGRLPEATQAIDRALQLGAGSDREAAILAVRAQIQYGLRAWPEVIQTTNQLARLQGYLPDRVRLMRVEALFETGRLELARRAIGFEFDDEEDPLPGAVLIFARYRGAEEPEQARKLLEGAAKRHPENVPIQAALAQLELAAGRSEQALVLIDRALASDMPEARSATLRGVRAQVLLRLGRLDEARAEALRAFQDEPGNVQNANLLAAIYAEQKQLDQAVATFEEAQELGTLSGPGQELLARLYSQVGQDDKAIALYERVLEQDGSQASVKNDLAYLLAKKGGDLERALDLARQAHSELGEDPRVSDTLGFVYYQKKLYAPAVEQFRFAIEAADKAKPPAPKASASYQYHLGLALRGLDRNEEAMEAFSTAVALNPDLVEAKQALSELQARAASAPTPPS